MNTMSSDLRQQATNAGLMQLTAELISYSDATSWDIGNGISMESFLNQCAEAYLPRVEGCQREDYYLPDGTPQYDKICEAVARENPNFQLLYQSSNWDNSGPGQDFVNVSNVEIVDVSPYLGAVTTCTTGSDGVKRYTVCFSGSRSSLMEWEDNAAATVEGSSIGQQMAADYYDCIYEKYGMNDPNAVFDVTGHSKGGNEATYATIFSMHRGSIENCYAFDAPGLADADQAEAQIKTDFDQQLAKITLIRGENDYISSVQEWVPDDQQYFLSTHNQLHSNDEGIGANLQNDHVMAYLFHHSGDTFQPLLSQETNQGAISAFTDSLFTRLKDNLTPEQFAHVVRTVSLTMQGDTSVTAEDIALAISYIGEDTLEELWNSPEGQELLSYLPVTALGSEGMQGADGICNLVAFWLLSIPSDSKVLKAFEKALEILGADFKPLSEILISLAGGAKKATGFWEQVKESLYVNLGIGNNGNRKTAAYYADLYTTIEVDADFLRSVSADMVKAEADIKALVEGLELARTSLLEAKSQPPISLLASRKPEAALSAANRATQQLQKACNNLAVLGTALERMSEQLEMAEEIASKIGS